MKNLWTLRQENYQGMLMRCAPGVHEEAFAMLGRHGVTREGAVLDLASGSGAFIGRLLDSGYTDLTPVELDAEKFKCPGLVPLPIDLEGEFSKKFARPFALVTAIEIVEHLESPRRFLRQIHSLLQDGGKLLISTPNVSNWIGRIKFLRRGNLRYFEADQYRFTHHISPVTDVQMRLMLAETGFELLEWRTTGKAYGSLKTALLSPMALAFRLFLGPSTKGEVNMYIARKSNPAADRRPLDWHDRSEARPAQ